MRRRRNRIFLIAGITAIVTLAVAALAWTFRVQLLELVPTPPVVITEADSGRVVSILQGQRIDVRLHGNRLSGSRWRVGIGLPYLAETGEVTFTDDASPSRPGDGTQSTILLATGRGTGPLFMSYLPDSDQNSYTPSMSFRVVVRVR